MLVIAVMLITGCSILRPADPGLYDAVDAAAADLDLRSVGEIVHEGHYGSGGFSSDPPTLQVIMTGDATVATLEERAISAGFSELIDGAWERLTKSGEERIRFVRVDAGAVVAVGTGTHNGGIERITVEEPSLNLKITTYKE